MAIRARLIAASILASLTAWAPSARAKEVTLLNASYDVTRELYRDVNKSFTAVWQRKTGDALIINQSHGGSSKQARSVVDGLPADVVTMNQALDIDLIAQKSGAIAPDWANRLPNHAVPFTSTILFVVRKGNPKGIRDWDDLVRPGVVPVIPNPKTSGNGRYSYLAAWAYALGKAHGDEAAARAFVGKLFKAVPVLDAGGRAATSTFAQRGVGDVLLTFENEAQLAQAEFPGAGLTVVVPSVSVLAESPVAVVDRNAAQHGTTAVAGEYLRFLFGPEAQEIGAAHYFRPVDPAVLAKHGDRFPKLRLVSVADLGGWAAVQNKHFADGGVFDQLFDAR
ncbi:MAG TPA: sulfate ABC transporter substrate-binding protein [Polyangia bacterium]|nr:sulfate ABC transporter substrate-binding protein [Polyangia bacterium]